MAKDDRRSAAQFLPRKRTLPSLARAAQDCQGCDLYRKSTQAVFGEGPIGALVMFVGEQPGEQEARKGHPFVGPAGRLLDQALEEAGIDRKQVYVTNAVKHFSFEERGKRRIHKKPRVSEMQACRPWLDEEIELVQPRLLVALGATAALSLAGRDVKITRDRGKLLTMPNGREILVTVHPSLLLRVPPEDRPAEYARFVEDLRGVRERIEILSQ